MASLSPDERIELVSLLTRLYQFGGGPRGRSRLLSSAGLEPLLPYLELEGPPFTVAASTVLTLEKHLTLRAMPGVTALGALLRELLTLGDLPQEDAAFVAGLLVRRQLIDDPQALSDLRQRYNIR